MFLILKTVVLLILELIIEYLFGALIVKLLIKREIHPLAKLLIGFFAGQALFQIVALGFIFTTGVLHHLTITWGVLLLVIAVTALVLEKDVLMHQLNRCIGWLSAHKGMCLFTTLVVLAFCYYVSVNGESNEDARYYIALMTTSVDTDSMFRNNVYNGYYTESLYLRRVLVTFEIQGAVLSQMTGIHPLLIARIFRANQNVILTSAAVYLCSKSLLWKKEEESTDKALLSVGIFWILQLAFADTIYTPAAFVLYRAYEAKAFTAYFIVLTGLYLCTKLLEEKDKRILLLIGIFLWGSVAVSTSAMLVAMAECAVLMIPVWMMRLIGKKKQEKLHAN